MTQEADNTESESDDGAAGSSKRLSKPASKIKGQTKKSKDEKKTRTRRQRTFPAASFEDALFLPTEILKAAPAGRIRRLTLFDELNKSPDSGPSRQLITNSNAYGLTTGSYQAEYLEVTDDAKKCITADTLAADKLRAQHRLAIDHIAPFKALYDAHAGQKVPSKAVLRDFLKEHNVHADDLNQCIDTFISNAKSVGLLKTVAGAERLLTVDHAVDDLPKDQKPATQTPPPNAEAGAPSIRVATSDLQSVCFYVSPIGDESSEERRHADTFLETFIEPAIEELKDVGILRVVRADAIGEAGMISTQVLEHLRHARLCIADLSFLNPNVMYEVALRHARKLPVVQIKRKQDKLPFDINQVRTLEIDTSSIYAILPQVETIRSQIVTLSRSALESPERVGNPITVFYPDYFQ